MLAFVTLGKTGVCEARATGGKPCLVRLEFVLGPRGFHLNERMPSFVADLQLIAGEPFTSGDEKCGVDRGT